MIITTNVGKDRFMHPVFHFNPEANVGDGGSPGEEAPPEPEVRRATLPDGTPAPQTEGDAGTASNSTTH